MERQVKPPSAAEIRSQLRRLAIDDPAQGVARARIALKGATVDDVRATAAGVLVDAGLHCKDRRATVDGLIQIRRLVKRHPDDGGLRYMLGTAYSTLAQHDSTPRPMWWESTRKLQISARRELWNSTTLGLSPAMEAQAWINLGNDLDRCGRWIEAYTAFRKALETSPNHPVASGWAAVVLNRYGRKSGNTNWRPLASRYARIAIAQLEQVAAIAPGAELVFAQLPVETDLDAEQPNEHSLGPYEMFIRENQLHLSMSLDASHPDCWDSLHILRISEADGSAELPPPLFAMLNICKANFLLARRLAWESRGTYFADSTRYADTLDSAVYGQAVSLKVLSLRSALDVLDQISVAANAYFEFGGLPSEVKFRTAWRTESKGEPLFASAQREVERGNFGMLALVSLADDFRDDGWLFGTKQLRNSATHRFIVAHSDQPSEFRDSPEIQRLSEHDLDNLVTKSLQIVRSALTYLIDAVNTRENRTPRGVYPSVTLPSI